MRDRDYYPAGAYYDSNAPYNQVEPPEIEFECAVAYTLERESTFVTNEAYYDDGWELCDYADTWGAYEYKRPSIPEMLNELVKYIDKELSETTERKRKAELVAMRESAIGWKIVDRDIEIL